MTITNEEILKNYEQVRKDEDRYNQNSFEIRKLASTWFLTVCGGIAFLMTQYDWANEILLDLPPAVANFPLIFDNSVHASQLIALVAFFGLIGTSTLAILDIFLYLQLLKATALVSIEMERKYPHVLVPTRHNVLNTLNSGWIIFTLASTFFYLIPMLLLVFIMYLFSWSLAIVGSIYLLFLCFVYCKLPIPSLSGKKFNRRPLP